MSRLYSNQKLVSFLFPSIVAKIMLIFFLLNVIFICVANAQTKKRKTIVIEDIKIEGTIDKPEAIYFLSRARFNYETLNLNISFVNKIRQVIYTDPAF